jgi:DNA polymerase III subunit beta
VKFRCERDVLAEALGACGRAATGRTGALPVLSGVRLALSGDSLTVTGTDLELTIEVSIVVNGERDGVSVIPARLAGDIVRSLDAGAVTLDASATEVQISAGRTSFAVRPLAADDYPKTAAPAPNAVTMSTAALSEAVKQVVRAASKDESRPVLTGVLMAAEEDGVRLVATDSYRLAIGDIRNAPVLGHDQKVLVPSRALAELARLLSAGGDITLRLGERDATFEAAGTRLTTRLIEGEFPPYRQLVPKAYPNRLVVNRAALLDAIRRVKLLARDATPIRLTMAADRLELAATTQDVGQAAETIDATFTGTELTVAFNPDYLADGVDAITGDDAVLDTQDGSKLAVLRSSDETSAFVYLLMPVRVP